MARIAPVSAPFDPGGNGRDLETTAVRWHQAGSNAMRMRLRLTAPALLSLLTLVFSTGCGSSATTSTATSPTSINRCAVTVNGNGQVPAQGGAGSLAVTAARECVWSASAEGQWLTIKTGATGQGDGAIEFNAAANPDPVVRRGAIVLNEQRVEVSQAAGECAYSLSEASGSFPQAGGAGQFEVRASSGLCSWTAQSDAAGCRCGQVRAAREPLQFSSTSRRQAARHAAPRSPPPGSASASSRPLRAVLTVSLQAPSPPAPEGTRSRSR